MGLILIPYSGFCNAKINVLRLNRKHLRYKTEGTLRHAYFDGLKKYV